MKPTTISSEDLIGWIVEDLDSKSDYKFVIVMYLVDDMLVGYWGKSERDAIEITKCIFFSKPLSLCKLRLIREY